MSKPKRSRAANPHHAIVHRSVRFPIERARKPLSKSPAIPSKLRSDSTASSAPSASTKSRERVTGVEPATLCLASRATPVHHGVARHSTARIAGLLSGPPFRPMSSDADGSRTHHGHTLGRIIVDARQKARLGPASRACHRARCGRPLWGSRRWPRGEPPLERSRRLAGPLHALNRRPWAMLLVLAAVSVIQLTVPRGRRRQRRPTVCRSNLRALRGAAAD